MRKSILFSVSFVLCSLSAVANAEEHIIKAVITQWDPMIVFAQPGDSIRFTNMAGHDTQLLAGMHPEGVEMWQSKMGDEGFSVTLEKEGAYVYKCNPHITTGMVGAVVVGDPAAVDIDALNAAAEGVEVGANMVKRTIRKMKKAIAKQSGS